MRDREDRNPQNPQKGKTQKESEDLTLGNWGLEGVCRWCRTEAEGAR